MASFVLSVAGSDRPGLTRALAGAVLSAGGNWRDSHLSLLGGLYVGSVLVEMDAEAVDVLRAAVRRVDAHGLEVRVAPALDTSDLAGDAVDGVALKFALVGQDRPGIVSQVTAALSGAGANIEAFRSWISAEPYSGVPLFNAQASLRLPPHLPVHTVQAALEEISAEIMVDITLTPEP